MDCCKVCYKQLVQIKPQTYCMTSVFKLPRSWFALRLLGHGLALVYYFAGRGDSNGTLSCCQKFLVSESEPMNYLCKTKYFSLYWVSHPKTYSQLPNITIKYQVTNSLSLMFKHATAKFGCDGGGLLEWTFFVWSKMLLWDLVTWEEEQRNRKILHLIQNTHSRLEKQRYLFFSKQNPSCESH